MLRYNELSTILVEIEGVINSRPLTYVYDDFEGVSFPLTASHLINGRNLLQDPSHRFGEIISTYEALSKRAKYHFRLLWEFSKRWKREYLTGLMEAFKTKQHTKFPSLTLGDIVVLKDENTKRSFWKLAKVEELLKGRDGNVRTAKVKVPTDKGNKILIRPLRHLIPIELNSKQSIDNKANARYGTAEAPKDITGSASAAASSPLSSRPWRNAAVVGDLIRKYMY